MQVVGLVGVAFDFDFVFDSGFGFVLGGHLDCFAKLPHLLSFLVDNLGEVCPFQSLIAFLPASQRGLLGMTYML